MAKEVLALDVDDVVVKHVPGFINWSNLVHGTRLTTADYGEAWHKLWGISLEETEERKKQFFTDEVIGSFEVIEGASEGITALSSVRTIIGVTSRRESLRAVTEQTLDTIAPGAVQGVVFGTSFRNGVKVTRSKADICIEIGARDLIDDQLKHCLAVAQVGVRAIMFGDYDWQPNPTLPDRVVRGRDWPETLTYFDA